MKKITPVLLVPRIEPVLPFWVDRLGFEKTVEMPHEDHVGFVILTKGDLEIMYQTVDSVQADIAPLGATPPGCSFLFIQVGQSAELDAIERALDGVPLVVPRRTTFYGADEVIVRDPAGNAVTFAYFAEEG